MALILGLGVFLVIVAIGWRSVQNRRILRMQGADGKETIIVAREDDEISDVTTTQTVRAEPAPPVIEGEGAADPAAATEFGRGEAGR